MLTYELSTFLLITFGRGHFITQVQVCDGQFWANCADRGKLGGDDLAAGDDLADLATERAGKSFTTPPGHFCLGLL